MRKYQTNYRITVFGNKIFKNERVIIHTEEPHIESLANLIKLKKFYSQIDSVRRAEKEPYKDWLRFRKKWLKEQKRKHGKLTCHYCKVTNLKANNNCPLINDEKQKATIDHVIPVSRGGKRYDERNLVVCCWVCNQKKGDKMPQGQY